jgi:hypothetical protein
MRRFMAVAAMMAGMTLPAFAAHKITGTTTLRDSQPSGATDKKHKHQSFDLMFDAETKHYTCRTDPSKPMNATDFVVGELISYQIDGQKVKIETAENKKVDCIVVRVEAAGAAGAPPPVPAQY